MAAARTPPARSAVKAALPRCSIPRTLGLMVATLACAGPVAAQIYTGTLDNGSVVLSDRPSSEANVLLIEAPPKAAQPASALEQGKSAGSQTVWTAMPPITPPLPINGYVPPLPAHLRPLFQAAARDHRLSASLLAAVAAAESAFDPRALSPKGAAGLMQLMPATALRFKVGNRYSPVQSLNGGAAYLRWLSDRYGNDLKLVLAAYNAGEQAVGLADGVPPYAETQAYVQRVLHYLKHFSKVI
jgi:soluble lytic murein transglycosylase-like protein